MQKKEKQLDKKLLTVLFVLIVFGLIMIASAGISYSQSRFGDHYYFFKRQLMFGVFPGLIILFIAQKINYNFWKKISLPFFVVSIFLLALVFIPELGSKAYGASRWLKLGFFFISAF